MPLCNTIPSLPSTSIPSQHNNLSFPSSLPFFIKQKTNFTLSCQPHSSSDLSHSFSHSSDLTLRTSQVACTDSDLVQGLLKVALKDHKKAQTAIQEWFLHNRSNNDDSEESEDEDLKDMFESHELKALFVMSKYTEFEIKFCHSIETLKQLQEPNLSKLPFELLKSMKQRAGGGLQAEDRGLVVISYHNMMFCGLEDHHNQHHHQHQQKALNEKQQYSEELKKKFKYSSLLFRSRIMQLFRLRTMLMFQRIDDNDEMCGLLDIPWAAADAYLYGAFCSMCCDELSGIEKESSFQESIEDSSIAENSLSSTTL